MPDQKKCPVCAESILLEARVCRFCGAKFEVHTQGYCSNCKEVREATADEHCRICGGPLIDIQIESELIKPEPAIAEQSLPGESPAAVKGKAPSAGSRLIKGLVFLVFFGSMGFLMYVMLYHNGPPIPGVEGFFKTVKYEVGDAEPMALQDGVYIWKVTNKNDFAWPDVYIMYGKEHGIHLKGVEPGKSTVFSNLLLVNTTTKQVETVKFEQGKSAEITLLIDFSEEDSLPARARKLLKMGMVRFSLGVWSIK